MTTPAGQTTNFAGDGANVGVQGQIVTVTGDVQLTVGQDASPEVKYQTGAKNLTHGNVSAARKLIWEAMMGEHVNNEVLFHWLVAMLSGRTVRQFSQEEIGQLKHLRPLCTEAEGDPLADGVRLMSRLLDSAIPSLAAAAQPKAAKTDMSRLMKEFHALGEEQRDMLGPHLELFLTGELKNEMWQRELESAQSRQHADDRLGRAWMFFQPDPAEVILPRPQPELVTGADRLAMRASAVLFAAAAGYLGWELLWHGAVLGLFGYVAGLAGAAVAATTSLELRFLTGRRRPGALARPLPGPSAK
jgi:hypothetical protein